MPIQTATYNLTTDTFVRDFGDGSVTKEFSTDKSGFQEIRRLTGLSRFPALRIGESIVRFINNVAYFLKSKDLMWHIPEVRY